MLKLVVSDRIKCLKRCQLVKEIELTLLAKLGITLRQINKRKTKFYLSSYIAIEMNTKQSAGLEQVM